MQICSVDDYRVEFSAKSELECDEIWIAGGVYGNIYALQSLNEMAKDGKIVYNGDLHWFDASLETFEKVEKLSEGAIKLNGNVEIELKRDSGDMGCGCNYPPDEDEMVVKNAELIFRRLKECGADFSIFNSRKTTLHAVVGLQNIAITHGDEMALNGWGFWHENLNQNRINAVKKWLEKSKFSILATTHTCKALTLGLGQMAVINNGSAGMPNFSEFATGLVSRIATTPHQKALYRKKLGSVFVELLMLRYDKNAFLKYFEALWDDNSPASLSYKARILGYGCPMSYKQINFGEFKEI